MNENAPARKAMAYYFVLDHAGRKGNRVTIATALSNEYISDTGYTINTSAQYQDVVSLAQDRESWKQLVKDVSDKYTQLNNVKVQRKKELRLIAMQNRSSN